MKSLGITFWGVVQLVGCSVGKPSQDEIAQIEAVTSKNTCIENLSKWHREYQFQPALGFIGRGVDKSLISVAYTQAGHRGAAAGSFSVETPTRRMIDDDQYAFAWGTWYRASRRFKEWDCGCNFGSPINRRGAPVCKPPVR